jgi:hypothetical protein
MNNQCDMRYCVEIVTCHVAKDDAWLYLCSGHGLIAIKELIKGSK